MIRIAGRADLEAALDALSAAEPRLARLRAAAGEIPLRLAAPGLASLAAIVISQQVSRASADAIQARFARLFDPLSAPALLAAGDEAFRAAGLSRAKQRTLLALAGAMRDGLDLAALCDTPAGEAMARLTAVSGIGPWTAEVYLLFCAGHPDIFPAGDVALRAALGDALGLAVRPTARQAAALAESWSPWRGAAARLLWAHYRVMRGRDAAPLDASPASA